MYTPKPIAWPVEPPHCTTAPWRSKSTTSASVRGAVELFSTCTRQHTSAYVSIRSASTLVLVRQGNKVR